MAESTIFESGLVEVRLLVHLCDEAASHGQADRDNAIYRASVVLLVSHFESYLKDIADRYSDVVNEGKLESRQIPKGMRELHTLPLLREVIESKNDQQRSALMKKLHPIMALWNESAKPPPGLLTSNVLSRAVTSAKGEVIDELFNLMGHSGLVCDGDLDITLGDGETTTVNIRLSLSDVVKCRNDIAHGDSSRRPTGSDVERYIRFLEAMAGRLERKAEALMELVSA